MAAQRGLLQRAPLPFVAGAPNRCYYHYNNICFLSPGMGDRELLNQICRGPFQAAAEEKEGFQTATGVGMISEG